MTVLVRRSVAAGMVLMLTSAIAACGGSSSSKTPTPAPTLGATASRTAASGATPAAATSTTATMTLTSDAFADGGTIPTQFTCAGASLQPPLTWSGTPSGTQALALLMEDTDVPGIFDHWVVYDLPANVTSIDLDPHGTGDFGQKEGKSSRGSVGYLGPCPPPGASPHHYRFRIYALDAMLGLTTGAAKADVLAAMQGHVLAQGELTGLFSR